MLVRHLHQRDIKYHKSGKVKTIHGGGYRNIPKDLIPLFLKD